MLITDVSRRGKVRDLYDLGDHLLMVSTDRISAFDSVLNDVIPHKGTILNQMSAFWFRFTNDIITNHMISIDIEDFPEEFHTDKFYGCSMLVKKLTMLPIECVVRGYITGSAWKSYQETGMVCGIKLPAGLKESEKLPVPIYTPTTKSSMHDEPISFEDTVIMFGPTIATQLREKSLEIYSKCSEYAYQRGIIIADTKFEFGVDKDGTLVLADELLTPDSSRFWDRNMYSVGRPQRSFDKQYLRNWLNAQGWDRKPPAPRISPSVIHITTTKYMEAYRAITGK